MSEIVEQKRERERGRERERERKKKKKKQKEIKRIQEKIGGKTTKKASFRRKF